LKRGEENHKDTKTQRFLLGGSGTRNFQKRTDQPLPATNLSVKTYKKEPLLPAIDWHGIWNHDPQAYPALAS
jgi:hypothetical protein